LNPKAATSYAGLGLSLFGENTGRAAETKVGVGPALASLEVAVKMEPGNNQWLAALGVNRWMLCGWKDRTQIARRLVDALREEVAQGGDLSLNTFFAPFVPYFSPLAVKNLARRGATMAYETLAEASVSVRKHELRGDSYRLESPATIGFISADFGNHIVGTLVRSLFDSLSPSKYRSVCMGTRQGAAIRDGRQPCIDLSSKAPHESSEMHT